MNTEDNMEERTAASEQTAEKTEEDIAGATEERTEENGTEQPETVTGEKAPVPEAKKKEKKHTWKLFLGILLGMLFSFVLFIFWRGYIRVPIPGYTTIMLKLPTYGMFGETSGPVDGAELNSKIDAINAWLDEEYYYTCDQEGLVDAAASGVYGKLTSEDGYAEYYTKEELQEESETWRGSFVGLGIYVTTDEETGGVRVVRPIKGGPGAAAGLKAGDVILEADGTDLCSMDLDTATGQYLKGEEGTSVHIVVLRDGHEIEFDIVRQSVDAESVYYSVLEQDGKKIGYVYVSSFLTSSVNAFMDSMDYFMLEEVDGIVVDLRDDTGGDMNACLDMLDYILEDDLGTYTQDEPLESNRGRTLLLNVRSKNGKEERYFGDDGHSVNCKFTVLVNGYSASASEIFTGVMRSYGVKTCGTTTYGKGIVQTLRMLYDMSGIKYTSAEYMLPDSSRIHGVGIEPDVTVEPSEEFLEVGGDPEKPDPSVDNMLAEAIRLLGE